jgi:hypothetical protein
MDVTSISTHLIRRLKTHRIVPTSIIKSKPCAKHVS